MPLVEREQAENLLLLCRKHHKIIDDDESLYTVDKLQSIKSEYLSWKERSLAKTQPWQTNLSQLAYINVPRLCEVAELQGYSVDLSNYKEDSTLHSLGWELNHVMSAFKQVLSNLSLATIPIESVKSAHEGYIGSVISFDRKRFRTKNVPMNGLRAKSRIMQVFSGDLSRDPHIYFQGGSWTLILNIDANWITTNTAFTLFRPSSGQSMLSGLARITNVDYENNFMFGTPWVLGIPSSPLNDMPNESVQINTKLTADQAMVDFGLDVFADIDEGKKRLVFFSPPPEACNLCRRVLSNDKYMIDGEVVGPGYWACMCSACFAQQGKGIGCGIGQLYIRYEDGWLEVAGFCPEIEDYQ